MEHEDKFISIVKQDFSKKHILVLGDLMVDEYVIGNVGRISPEAPVPVLSYVEKKMKAGGAANVANNIRTLGCNAYISGIADMDDVGVWLRNDMQEKGINIEGIVKEKRPTSVKTRYMTKGQQLLRMDNEVVGKISSNAESCILEYLEKIGNNLDAVILSDYKKGVLDNEAFIVKIISFCNEHNILVSIDSKSRNINSFKNADFVKPNNLELEEAVGVHIVDEKTLDLAGELYLNKSGAKCLIVTRGAEGISIFQPNKKRQDYASKAIQVFDVTGAGDTVISTITLGMACGLDIGEAVQLANYAASVVIGKVGTATVTQEELIERVYED